MSRFNSEQQIISYKYCAVHYCFKSVIWSRARDSTLLPAAFSDYPDMCLMFTFGLPDWLSLIFVVVSVFISMVIIDDNEVKK